MPAPLCRAAIVVGPPSEGIQKNPSVSNPFKWKGTDDQWCMLQYSWR